MTKIQVVGVDIVLSRRETVAAWRALKLAAALGAPLASVAASPEGVRISTTDVVDDSDTPTWWFWVLIRDVDLGTPAILVPPGEAATALQSVWGDDNGDAFGPSGAVRVAVRGGRLEFLGPAGESAVEGKNVRVGGPGDIVFAAGEPVVSARFIAEDMWFGRLPSRGEAVVELAARHLRVAGVAGGKFEAEAIRVEPLEYDISGRYPARVLQLSINLPRGDLMILDFTNSTTHPDLEVYSGGLNGSFRLWVRHT